MGPITTPGKHKGKPQLTAAAAVLHEVSAHYAAVNSTTLQRWHETDGEAAPTGRPGTPLALLGLIFYNLVLMAMKDIDGVKVFATVANVTYNYDQVRKAARAAYEAWAPTAPAAERERASKLRWTDRWVKTFLFRFNLARHRITRKDKVRPSGDEIKGFFDDLRALMTEMGVTAADLYNMCVAVRMCTGRADTFSYAGMRPASGGTLACATCSTTRRLGARPRRRTRTTSLGSPWLST